MALFASAPLARRPIIETKCLRSGFTLPLIGLGTWKMGGDLTADPKAHIGQEVEALRAGLAMGFRHIDTAEIYAEGASEMIVATAIRDQRRSDLVIASKVSRTHHAYDALLRALEGSLKRLMTPYLDIYYSHAPNLEVPLAETARALNHAHREGLIRHIAVSNFLPQRLDALQSLLDSPIVANQVHFNLMCREPSAVGMLEHAAEKDYFIVAWRPVRFAKQREDQAVERANAWEKGAYPLLDDVATREGKTNVQTALNWVTSHPQTVALVKSSNVAHLQEALGANGWALTNENFDALTRDFEPQILISDSIPLQ